MSFRIVNFGDNEGKTPDNIPRDKVSNEERPGAIDQRTVRHSPTRAQETPLSIDQGKDVDDVCEKQRELDDNGKVKQRRKMPKQSEVQSVIDENCTKGSSTAKPTQDPVARIDRELGIIHRDVAGSTAPPPQPQGSGAYSETETSEEQKYIVWKSLLFTEQSSKESKPDSFEDHKNDASRHQK